MNINGIKLKLSEQDRLLLTKFFAQNQNFIENNNFIYYEYLKTVGDAYEKFINENNLQDNDILKLFLLELRYDELCYKIIENNLEFHCLAKYNLNQTISKWYKETINSNHRSI